MNGAEISLDARDLETFFALSKWWELAGLRGLLGSQAAASRALGYSFGPDGKHPEYAFLAASVSVAQCQDVKRLFVFLDFGALVTFDIVVPVEGSKRPHFSISGSETGFARAAVLADSENKTSGDALFLNVIQRPAAALPVQAFSNMDIAGVRIGDWVTAFYTEPASASAAVSFDVPGSGKVKYLVAGLAPGTWEIWRNGWLEDPQAVVERAAGALYFEAPAGGYFIRKRG